MTKTITANCPACKTDGLTVQVGKKSTVREASCFRCHARYTYSAWVTSKRDGMVFHQVDLFPLENA